MAFHFLDLALKLHRRSIHGSPDGKNQSPQIHQYRLPTMTSSGRHWRTYHVYDAIYFFFELYLEELGVLVPHLDLTHRRMYHHEIPCFWSKMQFWL